MRLYFIWRLKISFLPFFTVFEHDLYFHLKAEFSSIFRMYLLIWWHINYYCFPQHLSVSNLRYPSWMHNIRFILTQKFRYMNPMHNDWTIETFCVALAQWHRILYFSKENIPFPHLPTTMTATVELFKYSGRSARLHFLHKERINGSPKTTENKKRAY